MVETQTPPTMHSAVVGALSELSEIVADERADTGNYSYKYASLAGIMKTVRPVLARHKLAVSQYVSSSDDYLRVATVLVHESGDIFQSGVIGAKMPAQPQQVGSLISYLRRYQLVALLGLAIEDDDARGVPTTTPAPPRAAQPSSALGDAQRRLIMALFGDLGLNGPENRDERLMITADIIGRELASTNEVTPSEASVLIDELQRRLADLHGQGY